jgi:hypothetical protein
LKCFQRLVQETGKTPGTEIVKDRAFIKEFSKIFPVQLEAKGVFHGAMHGMDRTIGQQRADRETLAGDQFPGAVLGRSPLVVGLTADASLLDNIKAVRSTPHRFRNYFTLGVKTELEMFGQKFKVGGCHPVEWRVPIQEFDNRGLPMPCLCRL